MENFPTSTRSIEVQLMRRFISEFSLSSFCLPESFQSDFSSILRTVSTPVVHGSLKSTLHGVDHQQGHLHELQDWSYETIEVKKSSSYILSVFSPRHIVELKSLFLLLYPHILTDEISINSTFQKYTTLEYRGNRYLSCAYSCSGSQYHHNNYITLAQHCFNVTLPAVRPVVVNFFVYMSFYHQEKICEHMLVCVSWLHEHPAQKEYGSPLEIWWKDMFQPDMLSFIPVQCLIGNCAYMDIKHEEQTVLLICPTKNVKI